MTKPDISLIEMLQSGVHFGHKSAKKHPKMDRFIFGARNNISIIDLEQTKLQLDKILPIFENLTAQGKKILFLGTKRQAQKAVKETAEKLEMPYIIERWIGGLFTNYHSVSGLMKKLTTLKEGRDGGEWEKRYNKKERLVMEREIKKLEKLVGGIENMDKLPDAIFVVDCGKESTAVREANYMKIPVFAIADTNANPLKITYPIPANDDGIKSIVYILSLISEAIQRGAKRLAENPIVPATTEISVANKKIEPVTKTTQQTEAESTPKAEVKATEPAAESK
ncbi:MAG: 30S ribosomal protein S2 [bacterium]|nr:30S ribosomal protein S2 [bacterium]